MNFGSKLQSLLDQHNLTKTELGNRIGVSQAYISQLCHNQRQPSLKVIDGICSAFGITREELFSDESSVRSSDMQLSVTQDEFLLIQKYRLLCEHDKKTIRSLLDVMPCAKKEQLSILKNGDSSNTVPQ